jgi:hypothetical protein
MINDSVNQLIRKLASDGAFWSDEVSGSGGDNKNSQMISGSEIPFTDSEQRVEIERCARKRKQHIPIVASGYIEPDWHLQADELAF